MGALASATVGCNAHSTQASSSRAETQRWPRLFGQDFPALKWASAVYRVSIAQRFLDLPPLPGRGPGLGCLLDAQRIKVHAIGGFTVKRGMGPALLVELEIAL